MGLEMTETLETFMKDIKMDVSKRIEMKSDLFNFFQENPYATSLFNLDFRKTDAIINAFFKSSNLLVTIKNKRVLDTVKSQERKVLRYKLKPQVIF